jgi:hypothetical protein
VHHSNSSLYRKTFLARLGPQSEAYAHGCTRPLNDFMTTRIIWGRHLRNLNPHISDPHSAQQRVNTNLQLTPRNFHKFRVKVPGMYYGTYVWGLVPVGPSATTTTNGTSSAITNTSILVVVWWWLLFPQVTNTYSASPFFSCC